MKIKFIYLLFFTLCTITTGDQSHQSVLTYEPNSFLQFLYSTSTGSMFRPILTRPWFTKSAGWYADTRISRFHIKSFARKHKIALNEAVKDRLEHYKTFNDFFTRKLKPEARPINDEKNSIISPADGRLYAYENLNENSQLFVKGQPFDLAAFLQDKELAKKYYNGTLVVIYLAPTDYHRFHFPVDAHAALPKQIAGRYESVNPFVYKTGVQSLQENERQLIELTTKDCGTICLVAVGAMCVGKITSTFQPKTWHQKGDEAGYFSFGGSTVILLFEKEKISLNDKIIEQQQNGKLSIIKMGQKIGTKQAS
jgi:phosphatidylserine decarboxylase